MINDTANTIITRLDDDLQATPFWYPCFGKNDQIIYYIRYYTDPVTKQSLNALYSVDVDGGNNILIDENGKATAPIEYASIGDKLVYEGGDWPYSIYVYDACRKNIKNYGDFVETECRAIGPHTVLRINEEGTRVVAGTDYCKDVHIYSINLDNSGFTKLPIGMAPDLSKDGNSILFLGVEKE